MTLCTGIVDVTVISGRTRLCTTYTVLVHVVFINKIIWIFAKPTKIYKYVLYYFTLHILQYIHTCTKSIGRMQCCEKSSKLLFLSFFTNHRCRRSSLIVYWSTVLWDAGSILNGGLVRGMVLLYRRIMIHGVQVDRLRLTGNPRTSEPSTSACDHLFSALSVTPSCSTFLSIFLLYLPVIAVGDAGLIRDQRHWTDAGVSIPQSTQSCNRCFLAYIQWWG